MMNGRIFGTLTTILMATLSLQAQSATDFKINEVLVINHSYTGVENGSDEWVVKVDTEHSYVPSIGNMTVDTNLETGNFKECKNQRRFEVSTKQSYLLYFVHPS